MPAARFAFAVGSFGSVLAHETVNTAATRKTESLRTFMAIKTRKALLNFEERPSLHLLRGCPHVNLDAAVQLTAGRRAVRRARLILTEPERFHAVAIDADSF